MQGHGHELQNWDWLVEALPSLRPTQVSWRLNSHHISRPFGGLSVHVGDEDWAGIQPLRGPLGQLLHSTTSLPQSYPNTSLPTWTQTPVFSGAWDE